MLALFALENYVALINFDRSFPVWRSCLVLQNYWDEIRKKSARSKIPEGN